MADVAKTEVFPIPSVSRDKPSQSINWRAVTSDMARSPEPEVRLYPFWLRLALFAIFGLGSWAVVIGILAMCGLSCEPGLPLVCARRPHCGRCRLCCGGRLVECRLGRHRHRLAAPILHRSALPLMRPSPSYPRALTSPKPSARPPLFGQGAGGGFLPRHRSRSIQQVPCPEPVLHGQPLQTAFRDLATAPVFIPSRGSQQFQRSRKAPVCGLHVCVVPVSGVTPP